jgi:hypothetical protein
VLAGLRLGEYVAQLERGLQMWALVGTIVVFFIVLTAYRRMFTRIAHTMGVDLDEIQSPERSYQEPSSSG